MYPRLFASERIADLFNGGEVLSQPPDSTESTEVLAPADGKTSSSGCRPSAGHPPKGQPPVEIQLVRAKDADEARQLASVLGDALADSSAPRRIITAYQISSRPPALVKPTVGRDWMESSPNRFAYRCLPLVIANQAGWDLLNPTPFRAKWNGGPRPEDVLVEPLRALEDGEQLWGSGHFGSAVLTANVGYLFRTPPGIGLQVSGPPNSPKDGLHPLSGIVETDWSHSSFTMNYLFTRPDHWVTFDEGESLCRILPVDFELLEGLAGELRDLRSEPDLADKYFTWSKSRDAFNESLQNPFSEESQVGWQKEYFQGKRPTGERQQGHRTQLGHAEFGDHRPESMRAVAAVKPRPPRRDPRSKTPRTSASHFLWTDDELFPKRQTKCAEVLIALAKSIRRCRPLVQDDQQGEFDCGEESFLGVVDRLTACDAEIFTTLWSEPIAHHWTRVAYDLVGQQLAEAPLAPTAENYVRAIDATSNAQALREHLSAFHKFDLAASLLAGRDLKLDKPALLRLPLTIPATQWTIVGQGYVEVAGVCDGKLQLLIDGKQVSAPLKEGPISGAPKGESLRIESCPVIEHAGCQLRMQTAAVTGLGLDAACAEEIGDLAYQQRHAELLAAALRAIEKFAPEMFTQIADVMRVVVLKPQALSTVQNVSYSELPGAALLSVCDHPLDMADRLIHEYCHSRLFAIEDGNAIIDSRATPKEQRVYSPWRDDPRPTKGVLHGLYVFLAVGQYWLRVYESLDATSADRPLVVDRLRRTSEQTAIAAGVLAEHGRFTPFGIGVFDQLKLDVAGLRERIAAAGTPDDAQGCTANEDGSLQTERDATGAPISIRSSVAAHLESFDVTGSCQDLKL